MDNRFSGAYKMPPYNPRDYEHRFAEHEHKAESSQSIAPQHAAMLLGSETCLTAYPMVMDPPIAH